MMAILLFLWDFVLNNNQSKEYVFCDSLTNYFNYLD